MKKKVVVGVYLDEEKMKQLREKAKEIGIGLSPLIKIILNDYLKGIKKEDQILK